QVVNSPGAFHKVLFSVGDSSVVDMVVAVTWAVPGPATDALVEYYQATDKPLAVTSTAWLDDFQRAGVPTYTDPQRAANALGAVATQSLRPFRPLPPSGWKADTERVAR